MNLEKIEKSINEAFSNKNKINQSDKSLNKLIKETIDLLDSGKIRVAEKKKWCMASQSMDQKSNLIKF